MFIHSSEFKKCFRKLPNKIKDKVIERLDIFLINEFDIILDNHKLQGKYSEDRSINITGNVRLIYRKINNTTYYLISVGTHSQLYG